MIVGLAVRPDQDGVSHFDVRGFPMVSLVVVPLLPQLFQTFLGLASSLPKGDLILNVESLSASNTGGLPRNANSGEHPMLSGGASTTLTALKLRKSQKLRN